MLKLFLGQTRSIRFQDSSTHKRLQSFGNRIAGRNCLGDLHHTLPQQHLLATISLKIRLRGSGFDHSWMLKVNY